MYVPSDLTALCRDMRLDIVELAQRAGGGHVPSALSIVEILVTLYTRVLRHDPAFPESPQRDAFILSKGHGCAALYSILARSGYFSLDHLWTFGRPGSKLGGHPAMHKVPGVEASTGSLGHGLSIAVGMALAKRVRHRDGRVFCLVGDGECNEGSIWEAALCASTLRLGGLTAIVDFNRSGEEYVRMAPLVEKWQAFGWDAVEVDGHDVDALEQAMRSTRSETPTAVVARTTKGKGVSFMIDNGAWHHRGLNADEFSAAKTEILAATPLPAGA